MIVPVWAYAAGGAGALLLGAFGGWTVRDWKADSDALEASERAQKAYEAKVGELADASLRYEQLAQSLRADERRDRETIREIYRDKIVPAECAADPAAVRVLSEAVTRANSATAGQSGSKVP